MSFLKRLPTRIKGIFSRKPKEAAVEEAAKIEKPEAEAKRPVAARRTRPRPPKKPVVVKKPGEERLSQVILGARMSEKSARMAESGQHVFEVRKDSTRDEVRYAVEAMFNVKVASVRLANVRGKVKRQGRRSDWCKAYVRLAPGQTLEAAEVGT